MRFLRPFLLCAALASTTVSAAKFQIDIAGDNNFQVYVSHSNSGSVTHLKATDGQEIQQVWESPSRYTNVDLYDDSIVSVYVHNAETDKLTDTLTNPSAIVARFRETNSDTVNDFKSGGQDYTTNEPQWLCAWRHENTNDHIGYDPSRFTGSADDWAASNFDLTHSWGYIDASQTTGSNTFGDAFSFGQLGTSNIWDGKAATIKDALLTKDTTTGQYDLSTAPYWIYGNHQQTAGTPLAHHGWCRFKVPRKGNSPPGGGGDPIFTGFQGQVYQFHGLPDEHFNLVSSPSVQLNAHFVYLSSGKCDYNDTVCWTHPGTYMDVLGFSIGETRIKLVAGTHESGLRVWVNDMELARGARNYSLSEKTQASIKYHHHGKVQIHTELMDFEVANSDMFMNVNVALLNQELLRVGSTKHTITDKAICKHNEETYDHALVESKVTAKYPISTPMHGLIGQTWRNLKVCGREWMGTVQDYVTSSLFGTDYHYNYFKF